MFLLVHSHAFLVFIYHYKMNYLQGSIYYTDQYFILLFFVVVFYNSVCYIYVMNEGIIKPFYRYITLSISFSKGSKLACVRETDGQRVMKANCYIDPLYCYIVIELLYWPRCAPLRLDVLHRSSPRRPFGPLLPR